MENEWVEISDHRHKPIRKRMRLCNLPEAAKSTIREKLFGVRPHSQTFSEKKAKDDTKNVDTSWIKIENNEEELTSTTHGRNASNNNVFDKDQQCRRKHSRKYKPTLSHDAVSGSQIYSSSFPRPPKGLF